MINPDYTQNPLPKLHRGEWKAQACDLLPRVADRFGCNPPVAATHLAVALVNSVPTSFVP